VSYRVEIPDAIRERLAGWVASGCMPDALLVDVYNHLLGSRLAENPTGHLRKSKRGGWLYSFDVEYAGPGSLHRFVFRIVYGQDEQTLRVVGVGYFPRHI
jgi:hypothetical protein